MPWPAVSEAEVPWPAASEAEVPGPAALEAEVPWPAVSEAEVQWPAVSEAEEVPWPAALEAEVPWPAVSEAEVPWPAVSEAEVPWPALHSRARCLYFVLHQRVHPDLEARSSSSVRLLAMRSCAGATPGRRLLENPVFFVLGLLLFQVCLLSEARVRLILSGGLM